MSEAQEEARLLTDQEQAVADVLAKRAISDLLQPVLDSRVAAQAAVSVDEDGEEDAPTGTGTLRRYTAWSLPRGNVVIEMPSRLVEATFDTREEAETHAEQLNTWLSRRPTPDARYRRYVLPPEPTEASLIEMFDRLAEVDRYPAAAFKAVDQAVTAALADAEAADRVAARKRAETWQNASEEADEGGEMSDAVAKVEVFKDSQQAWRFSAHASNGEIVATSEGYVERRDALAEASKLFPDARIEIVESFLEGGGDGGADEG